MEKEYVINSYKGSLDKSIKKKAENEEKETKECTFNPILSEKTKIIIQNKEEV